MKMEIVKLTETQMIRAYTAGIKRQWRHRDPITGERFSTHRFTAYDTAFDGDIKGCLVECAVATYYGTQWNSEDWDLAEHSEHKGLPDVEPYFEVRRARTTKGQLTIRNTDAINKVAVLGCVDEKNENIVYLLGAIKIRDAREGVFEQDDNGNVYVPQSLLHTVAEFAPVHA